MKHLILLISFCFLSCTSKNDITFKNAQFKNELNSFIIENNQSEFEIFHIILADKSKIFEDVENQENETVFLQICSYPPMSCENFKNSFFYKGKTIYLYESSQSIKLSDLIELKKEGENCNTNITFNDYIDSPSEKMFFFDKNKKLIEIKEDGSQRIVK